MELYIVQAGNYESIQDAEKGLRPCVLDENGQYSTVDAHGQPNYEWYRYNAQKSELSLYEGGHWELSDKEGIWRIERLPAFIDEHHPILITTSREEAIKCAGDYEIPPGCFRPKYWG